MHITKNTHTLQSPHKHTHYKTHSYTHTRIHTLQNNIKPPHYKLKQNSYVSLSCQLALFCYPEPKHLNKCSKETKVCIQTRLTDNMKLLLIRILLLSHSFIFFRLYFLSMYIWFYSCLIACLCMATLTEVFPCVFLSCKTNARV